MVNTYLAGGFTIVVAVLSIGGTLFVERFRRAATDRRWLLDRRHEIYVDFLRVATEMQTALLVAANSDEEIAHRQARIAALQDAWFRITLVASTDVHNVAHAVHGALLHQTLRDPARRDALRAQSLELLGRLTHLMRKEIQPDAKPGTFPVLAIEEIAP